MSIFNSNGSDDPSKVAVEKCTVNSRIGLTAGNAVCVCQLAQKFTSKIAIEKNGLRNNAKSFLGILSLCIRDKDEISFVAEGKDSTEAVKSLKSLVESNSIQTYFAENFS